MGAASWGLFPGACFVVSFREGRFLLWSPSGTLLGRLSFGSFRLGLGFFSLTSDENRNQENAESETGEFS